MTNPRSASAWPDNPDYRVDATPIGMRARVLADGRVLAESNAALLVAETHHVDRLYFPVADVDWEVLEASAHHSFCPFKGQASYWSLIGVDKRIDNVVWGYLEPFPEVSELAGYVCFYDDKVDIGLVEHWPDDAEGTWRLRAFPPWGSASDLASIMDVEPVGTDRFVANAFPRVGFRDVVEGGQLLGTAIVAASRVVPEKRVTSATMVFLSAASFREPTDVTVDRHRIGSTFSTLGVELAQAGKLKSVGLVLADAGSDDVISHSAAMPDVPAPSESVPYDHGVLGRELRIVDAAYDPDPNRIGPPQIFVWCRFRESPDDPALQQALLAQSTTHWTIVAGLAPHFGFGEADAHASLSTGIISASITFGASVDVADWLLYATDAVWAGQGQVIGNGSVFSRDGQFAASFTTQGMVRRFAGGKSPRVSVDKTM